LNTATRGSRKEFPAVAVIVAEAQKVTIYDGDDPAMPMWMVFQGGSSSKWLFSYTNNAVSALNGKLVTAQSYNSCEIDFLTDDNKFRQSSNGGKYNGNISQRNAGLSYTSATHTQDLVSGTCNDVAMTVLPNAPIDSATGLPIPTIAVATDGGVSVIKDDGSVVDMTCSQAGYPNSHNVQFKGVGIEAQFSNAGQTTASIFGLNQLPVADIVLTNNVNGLGSADYFYGETYSVPALNGNDNLNIVGSYTKSNSGLNAIMHNLTTPASGSVAYITSDYNTGYMVGDIKLAALSDTDTTNVVGSELVTNGDGSSTTGWTGGAGATLSTTSGRLRLTNSTADWGNAYQQISTVVGKVYTLSIDLTNTGSSLGAYSIKTAVSGSSLVTSSTSSSSTFVATTTTTVVSLQVQTSTSGATADFDNISVRLADQDRSVNSNGLAVHGTITKTAVATGADLVGYSGFSSSNYLEQPYNSDLDFGTGDFSVMGWIKPTGGYDDGYIFQRGDAGTAGGLIALRRGYGGGGFPRLHWGSTGFDYDSIFNKKVPDDVWSFIVVMRSGNTIQTFVNAEGSGANTSSTNVSNTNGKLRMGLRMDTVGQAIQGSLALWRISATAPSAKQIKDIYEAEKPLFQAGAQATLYGTSDAVTALAHDDTTNLLHVGTPSGRSVFQGLRRVDNTTSAVGSAISASNNLVVED